MLFSFNNVWYSPTSACRLVTWFLRASMIMELASRLTMGLFLMFLALEAYLIEVRVSS